MLYDPKWEKQTETKPTLIGFVAWLEQQDPNGKYSWVDCSTCAIAQYFQTIGIKVSDVNFDVYNELEGGKGNGIALNMPHTFGAALKRAREHMRLL